MNVYETNYSSYEALITAISSCSVDTVQAFITENPNVVNIAGKKFKSNKCRCYSCYLSCYSCFLSSLVHWLAVCISYPQVARSNQVWDGQDYELLGEITLKNRHFFKRC